MGEGELADLREAIRLLREVAALLRGLGFGVPLSGPLGTLGAGVGLLELLFGDKEPKVELHQTIQINIGEGQISERAFWDSLVQYHIIPALGRGGLIPRTSGGAE